LALEVIS